MNESVKEEAVGLVFHVDVQVDQPTTPEVGTAPQQFSDMFGGLASGGGEGGDGTQAPETQDALAAPHVEVAGVGVERPRQPARLHYTAPSETGEVVERDVAPGARSNGSSGVAGLTAEQARVHAQERAVPLRVGQEVQDVPRQGRLTSGQSVSA